MNTQFSLFDNTETPVFSNTDEEFYIKGLQYIPNFISKFEHDFLLNQIDKQLWLNELKRRVQHYGYKYDYKFHRINRTMKTLELPEWLSNLSKKLYTEGIFNEIPDQVIINEYLPGQGITNHVDCSPCFSDTIVSLSLGSECVMYLTDKDNQEIKNPYLLERRSIIILKEDARYSWMHGIKAVKNDNYFGKKIVRNRRVSLTFRKVILG